MEQQQQKGEMGMGMMQSKLKKAFKRAVYPLLSTCSYEEICKAFPSFTKDEQRTLHQLMIKVITSLHGHLEDVFESLCDEMQVGTALDTVEQRIEEQNLDILSSDKSNVVDIANKLTVAKRKELQDLTDELETAEKGNRQIQARIELLKKERQEYSAIADALEKLTARMPSHQK